MRSQRFAQERVVREFHIQGLCVLTVYAAALGVRAEDQVGAADQRVTIHCPEELELKVLVDYVGKALDLRFVYGEEVRAQRFVLRPSPVQLPKERLLPLLTSLLRVHDLALVQEGAGLYRILRGDQASRSVGTVLDDTAPLAADSVRMVTQVLPVIRDDVAALAEKLTRFLSSPKASLLPVPEQGLLIVTDYESRIATLRSLLALLDRDASGVEIRMIAVESSHATTLATRLSAVLGDLQRQSGSEVPPASIRADVVPGALVVIGHHDQIQAAEKLAAQFAPRGQAVTTRGYSPRHMTTSRFREMIEKVVLAPGSGLTAPVQMHADGEAGRLFVTAPESTHAAIARMLDTEDLPLPAMKRPLRIYRPRHRTAAELIGALNQLLGDGGSLLAEVPPAEQSVRGNQTPAASRQVMPQRVSGPDYVLTVDEHTNAVMAVGTPTFHAQLAELIDELDVRRPQVLIEMTLVAITQNDSMDLGVELQALDLGDGWDFLLFSDFGLSTIDVVTGQRVLNPGVGANGILFRPDQAPVVLRALATRGLARVISTPRILVADNAQGVLRNVDEAPFTSVNASDTVATTSFGGFESAGTTLTVTPHISEGDHLTLEYELSFSNFSGGASGAGVPPPRTTNSFTSTVEVPDGYTIVTGGLVVDNQSDSISEVPFLGRIPGLGRLFQSSSRQHNKSRIFAFIRPVILREDKFEALKYISLEDLEKAEAMPGGIPKGAPLWMK